MGVHAEYYNLDGELFKKLDATEIKMIDTKNKKWLAHSLSIQNLKTKEYTHLQFLKVKANAGIPDSVFTQQNLQKVN
jgi:outer membrane lipoprotein-sorting protein